VSGATRSFRIKGEKGLTEEVVERIASTCGPVSDHDHDPDDDSARDPSDAPASHDGFGLRVLILAVRVRRFWNSGITRHAAGEAPITTRTPKYRRVVAWSALRCCSDRDVGFAADASVAVKRGSPQTEPSAVSSSRFVGQSFSLRFLPWLVIAVGFCTAISNGSRVPVGVFLLALGAFAAIAVPWRFVVVDEGIALWFGFGRRRFLPRDDVTVRVDLGGVRVLPNSEHFGYPLTDGISNRRLVILRAVLEEHGFRVLR
jgi:hypothetical protein